jgi:hypothetical protein
LAPARWISSNIAAAADRHSTIVVVIDAAADAVAVAIVAVAAVQL